MDDKVIGFEVRGTGRKTFTLDTCSKDGGRRLYMAISRIGRERRARTLKLNAKSNTTRRKFAAVP